MTKNICRVCLKTPKTRSRYVTIHEKHENLTLAVLFLQTSGFRIEDNEPQIFCDNCRLELIQCFQFIQKCKKTQDYLKGFELQPEEIKVEIGVLNETVIAESIIKIEEDDIKPEPKEVDDFKLDVPDDPNFNFDDIPDFDDFESDESESCKNNTTTKANLPKENIPCDLCSANPHLYATRKSLKAHKIKFHKINQCPFCYRAHNLSILESHKTICVSNPANKGKILTVKLEHPDRKVQNFEDASEDSKPVTTTKKTGGRPKGPYRPMKNIPCDLCPPTSCVRFKDAKALNKHKNNFHKINQCPFCKRQLVNLKPHKPMCKLNPANAHLLNKFKKNFKCVRCDQPDRWFSNSKTLNDHLRDVHSLEPTVNCQHCLKFYHEETIQYHEPYCARNPNKIERPDYDSRKNYRRRRVVCIHCGTMVPTSSLKKHTVKYHPETVQKSTDEQVKLFCDFCPEKSFSTRANLIDHMKVIHLKVPEYCNVCGAVFRSKNALYGHRRKGLCLVKPNQTLKKILIALT